jgi:hypothetical protein
MLPLDEAASALDQRPLMRCLTTIPGMWLLGPMRRCRRVEAHTVIFGAKYYGSVTAAHDLWAFAQ